MGLQYIIICIVVHFCCRRRGIANGIPIEMLLVFILSVGVYCYIVWSFIYGPNSCNLVVC